MLEAVSAISGAPRRPSRRVPRPELGDVTRYIDRNFPQRITLTDLAALAGLSVCRFVTVFRREMGMSPHRYVCGVRVRAAQDLLLAGVPAAIVATEVGFFDQSHLCRHFRTVCGMTPGQFLASRVADAPTRAGDACSGLPCIRA